MSKKDLASYLGTTPETISRKMSILKKRVILNKKQAKKSKLLDLDGLLLV